MTKEKIFKGDFFVEGLTGRIFFKTTQSNLVGFFSIVDGIGVAKNLPSGNIYTEVKDMIEWFKEQQNNSKGINSYNVELMQKNINFFTKQLQKLQEKEK